MRIAVNTRLLLKNRLEGIGWFTYETMKRITQNHPEHDFFFLFDRAFDDEFIFSKNITPIVLLPQARHPFLWYIWFEFSVRSFIEKNNIDLFISPDGYVSTRTKVPQIAVIHDINFHHYPKDLPPITRKYFNHYFPVFAKTAKKVVTVSNYSKNDICNSYGIEPSKVDVVFNGANEQYTPLESDEISNTRKLLSNGNPYFVFVGAFNPRKNIVNLLLAFDKFKSISNSNIKLVIVGEKMFGTSKMHKVLNEMKYQNEVLFVGRLQVDKLKKVIGSAYAMTYFSYFEGFGIPLLEAMKCGIPLVVSNRTAIPEVVGNAGLFVDPFDIEAMVKGMLQITNDQNVYNDLKEKSLLQQKNFSWDKTADLLYGSILDCLNNA